MMYEWHKVEDELPKVAGDYLVAWTWAKGYEWEEHHVDIVYFRGKKHWAKLEDKITHWTEKPKSPLDMEDDNE